jgi:hypothetical protein
MTSIIGSATPAEVVTFAHAALFSPTLVPTLHLVVALTKGYIIHFKATRTQRAKTNVPRRKSPRTLLSLPMNAFPPAPSQTTELTYAMPPCWNPPVVFSDQTGQFVIPSSISNNYLVVFYDYNNSSNSILLAILASYQAIHAKLYAAGLCPPPRLQRLDNECSRNH